MRPLRLELQGFSAYRSETTIDFGDHDLIVFTGPTGAGKSSIIDGIVFALYGSVARYDNEKLVAPIINALSAEARVRFDFSVGETTYTAVRIVRRTANGASTKEARLECGDEVLASTAQELTAEVERILGLSFTQFTKTVVLPQGDFARFLTERPRTRQLLLRQLLGLDVFTAVGKAARRRSRTIAAEITTYERVLSDGVPVTKTQINKMQAQLDALDAAQEKISVLGEERDAATGALTDAAGLLDELDVKLEALGGLQMPPEAKTYGSAVTKAEAALVAAEKSLEKAAAKHDAAVAKRAEYLAEAEIDAGFALYGELAALDDEIATLADTSDAAQAHLDAALASAEAAAVTLTDAEQAETVARTRAGAAGIAATLHEGDECPVCLQLIDELPSHASGDAGHTDTEHADAEHVAMAQLTEAEEARHVAAEAAHKATEAVTIATQAAAEFGARLDASNKARAGLVAKLDGFPTERQLTTQQTRAHAADEKLDAAADALAQATADVDAAAAALEDAAASGTVLKRQFTEARDAVSALRPPAPGEDSLKDDWAALVAWGKQQATALNTERKALAKDVAAAEKAVAAAEKRLVGVGSSFLAPGATIGPDQAPKVVANAHADARVALANSQDRLVRQNTQSEQLVTLQQDRKLADELGKHLASGMFERWIMTDVMHDLAERASTHLLTLSGGSFSLITNGSDFQVRDHRNADELRNARTLSGGETFLTSLSLSLALAESITELASATTPPLESMFLDEGFGTLDPETLDTVTAAIEELGASGRMIGVVTHIGELAERLPTRFDVQRGPQGATVQLHSQA